MSQSLDPTILSQSITSKNSENTVNDQHQNGISEKCLDGKYTKLSIFK